MYMHISPSFLLIFKKTNFKYISTEDKSGQIKNPLRQLADGLLSAENPHTYSYNIFYCSLAEAKNVLLIYCSIIKINRIGRG
ncbi:MAG: hypothetical protein CO001_03010 [Candidatus Portnoybacteria bacterium CG_4_8_14_3_um_filter_40_10]|uniref:Uncharacterized protein n=1 Tax=Candidatus Portnoybacteria bacterium CG_4_8_14_3_um_filter_40_10 TaxID=1974801 RepID=A0A2M7IHZ9_9BACT|nr:MAG: hypothetical protein CO001_03010 [Candidatus Portnoybacteria bacterium CG_4_8_14_3_um_filter_40_10]